MSEILRLENVSIYTPDGRVLAEKIGLSVSRGEIAIIQGENGSGKTTLIKAVLGHHRHFKGQITKNFLRVSYLPQLGNIQFFLPLTILDVIQLEVPDADTKAILNLGLIQSEESLSRPWNTASGGERQKALLTRTLLLDSELLIFDEPFNHLDNPSRSRLIKLLIEAKSKGCSSLLISHERISEFEGSQRLQIGAIRESL
jgi:ABC-type Mn2+/Zn2+ transport system ATPase subunit